MKRKNKVDIVRSSAAEYLTFITSTGESDVNAVYFEEKGFGSIALTPEAAIEQVATLTNEPAKLAAMSQAMDSSRIPYSTYKLCKDLLNLLNHSSRYEEVYGKVPLYAKLFVK